MHRHITGAALAEQRSATLRALRDSGWASGGTGTEAVTERVARMVTVDHGLVTGRLLVMLRAAPTRDAFEASLAAAAEPWRQRPPPDLLQSLTGWGDRVARLARRLPAPVARARVRGWFGRQPVSHLFVRRVLEEWVQVSEVPGVRASPPPAVAHCLGVGVLAVLPVAALPRVDAGSGVVRLVVEVVGGDDLAMSPRRRRGRARRALRQPPSRITWSFDFARRHYGPRVTEPPDAVVRLSATDLALLAEAGRGWRGNPGIVREGNERLAAALLDGVARREGDAGTAPARPDPGP